MNNTAPSVPSEAEILAGTLDNPAACDGCLRYFKVFNKCLLCGKDDRVRYGCEHRLQQGDICAACRQRDIDRERLSATPSEIESILRDVGNLKLANNYFELLAIQIRICDILPKD